MSPKEPIAPSKKKQGNTGRIYKFNSFKERRNNTSSVIGEHTSTVTVMEGIQLGIQFRQFSLKSGAITHEDK